MNNFLLPKEKTTYSDLLKLVNAPGHGFLYVRERELLGFVAALLSSVARNLPVRILDADLSEEEITKLGIEKKDLENKFGLDLLNFRDNISLLKAVKESTSKISVYTSGTTGLPKRVDHTIKTLTRQVRASDSHSKDVWGFAYNPTHMAGLQVLFQAIFNQNPIVDLFEKPSNEISDLIQRYKITHLSATPTFYRLLESDRTFPSLKRVTLGGEKSDGSPMLKLKKIFPNAKINDVYASTEAGTLFASSGDGFSIPDEISEKVKIKDGEIFVHFSLLGSSDSLPLDSDGFYATGDLIEWLDGKKFKILARKNEMINVGGYKVNPSEVEDILRKIDGVKNASVFGKKNSILGNILCADIIPERDANLSERQIRESLKSELQPFKIPRLIRMVDHFELTRTGKAKKI